MLLEYSVKWADSDDLFKLASGKLSDFFVDVKQTALRSRGHSFFGITMYEEAAKLDFPEDVKSFAVAGVALGGCPLASAVSTVCGMDALYVRKAAKDHGTKAKVEGSADTKYVVLLEDVVTTGGSSLDAVKTLTEAGYKVVGIVAVVDRDEGGRKAIEDAGLQFRSIFTRKDLDNRKAKKSK
jgi:orotate phosphoribosyltransferase